MAEHVPSRSSSTVIAVDLGGTKVAAAAITSRGAIRSRRHEPVDTSSPDAPVQQIARIVREIRETIDASAVGIAVPGLARRDGTVWAPNLPGWDAMPLAPTLRRQLKLPVLVESDRNAAVHGEAWRGAARGKSNVVVLIVGTGIGAGILSDGHLVRGAHELSGCAGWLVVSDRENAMTTRCGALEALVAGPAIAKAARMPSAEAAADAAREGDDKARAVFAKAGRTLGLGVANIISLFDPQIVVVTGGLAGASDLFLPELGRAVSERAQPLSALHVEIAVSTLGADANLLGAARLALSSIERRTA